MLRMCAAAAQAVKECAVPLGLNSTWAPCGRVVGVEAVLNLAHAQKYFPSLFFQLVCLPFTQKLRYCYFSISDVIFINTYNNKESSLCLQHMQRLTGACSVPSSLSMLPLLFLDSVFYKKEERNSYNTHGFSLQVWSATSEERSW